MNVAFLILYTDTVQWTCQLFKELHESVNQYLPKDHGIMLQNRSLKAQGEPEDFNVTEDKQLTDPVSGHTLQLTFKNQPHVTVTVLQCQRRKSTMTWKGY